MWDIYSIGDAAYLTAVLNAVAMLSGSGDMRTLAGIGFLVGFILVMFQGIVRRNSSTCWWPGWSTWACSVRP
jgi:conjugal transfer mating pair stabilization protein TraG